MIKNCFVIFNVLIKIFPEKKRLVNNRIDFSEISGDLELPVLYEIQTKSYNWFKEKGIKEVFQEVFPVLSDNKEMKIDPANPR